MGKRTGATIRQLGYPTKNSLKDRHEEYERHLNLSAGYVRSKPKYSRNQKEKAVEHYAEHGVSGWSLHLDYLMAHAGAD